MIDFEQHVREAIAALHSDPEVGDERTVESIVAKASELFSATIKELRETEERNRRLCEERNRYHDGELAAVRDYTELKASLEAFKAAAEEAMACTVEGHKLELLEADNRGFNRAVDAFLEMIAQEEDNAKALIESDKLRIEKLHSTIEGHESRLRNLSRLRGKFGRTEEEKEGAWSGK